MGIYAQIALVLAGFGVLVAIATLVFDSRTRKHKGLSREEFIHAFDSDGVPQEILDAVYKFFTWSWFLGNLTIAPDDSLECLADVEDDAALLMKKLGLKPLSEEARVRWNEQIQASRGEPSDAPRFSTHSNPPSQIRTVRDMVLWLDWVRQHQGPA